MLVSNSFSISKVETIANAFVLGNLEFIFGGLIFGMKFASEKRMGLLSRGVFLQQESKGLGLFHCNYKCI